MSKVSRKKLARGVVLRTEHVFQPLSDIGTSVSISEEQVDVKWAPFRLNFSIPVINAGASISSNADYPVTSFCIPFMVPPLQGYFEADQKTRNNTPQVILDEIAFSFDTRAEAAAIRMAIGATGSNKNLDFDVLDRLNVDISIVEKSTSFSGSTDLKPTREVESIRLGSLLFKDTTERMNPIVVDDLNKALDPYKSYLLKITAPDLWSGRTYAVGPPAITEDTELDAPIFVGVNVSLRLRHPLVAKTSKDDTQNAPSVTSAAETLGISTPTATDTVTADQSDGISIEMKKVDDLIHRGLDGGTSKDSLPTPYSHLTAMSGYEIIAVPMWGNFSRYQILSSPNASRLPYSTVATCDRRVIPINYPVIVHHVIAGVNYNDVYDMSALNPDVAGAIQPQVGFSHTVGVAIGTGLRSDNFKYQQVAYLSWANDDGAATTKTDHLIDKIRYRYDFVGNQPVWDFELMSIPMTNTGANGTGFVTQGQPFYAGKGVQLAGASIARTPCGDGAIPFPGTAQTSLTDGAEQFIEIRWQLSDPANMDPATNGLLTGEELYIGTGGHWVYLICEKLLVGGDGDLKV